ncbi:unnamed protein product [Urochloa decumbens]|uniref:DUF4283 domain-containing protein n=1 Tax=Urochloa decumbens TaxID=240449 RepID=A0ABC8X7X6_9POAL
MMEEGLNQQDDQAGEGYDHGKEKTADSGTGQHQSHTEVPPKIPRQGECNVCGMRNHSTEECRRKQGCEMCGYTNHGTYDCKREPLWNLGPELCAAQVTDQSFFFIDEHIDHRAARDKANTAIITVIRGELTAKQIEQEFKSIINSSRWKWVAKRVADNKFTMKFPTVKMIQDYSKFNLGMRSVDAQIKVEQWSSAMYAKGRLQMGWFKVSGIPIDQRGVRTIAKVGGLVGKTVAIDEGTRFKQEFVRVKIACRDVELVPPCAEGALGLDIYDFYFELEEPDRLDTNKQKQAIPAEDADTQPSPKKMRTEIPDPKVTHSSNPSEASTHKGAPRKVPGSAPAKMNTNKMETSGYKLDWQKTSNEEAMKFSQEDGEIIPAATYEPTNDDNGGDSSEASEGQGEFAAQAYKYLGGKSPNPQDKVWLARCDSNCKLAEEFMAERMGKAYPGGAAKIMDLDGEEKDDNITVLDMENLINPSDKLKEGRENRRWSERVQKITNADPQGCSGRKRALEGLYNAEMSGTIQEGVRMLMACAQKLMAQQPGRSTVNQLPAIQDRAQDDEDRQ